MLFRSISNLTVRGDIEASGTGGSYFGGIVGNATNTTVRNCDNYVILNDTEGTSVGGIMGVGKGITIIENCNNYAKVDAFYSSGGIIG